MDKFEQMLWASALTRIRQADAKGRGGTDEMFQAVVDRRELLIQYDSLIRQRDMLLEALRAITNLQGTQGFEAIAIAQQAIAECEAK